MPQVKILTLFVILKHYHFIKFPFLFAIATEALFYYSTKLPSKITFMPFETIFDTENKLTSRFGKTKHLQNHN